MKVRIMQRCIIEVLQSKEKKKKLRPLTVSHRRLLNVYGNSEHAQGNAFQLEQQSCVGKWLPLPQVHERDRLEDPLVRHCKKKKSQRL